MVMLVKASLSIPERYIDFERGRRVVFRLGESSISQLALDPGWRWSEHSGDGSGAATCPEPHLAMIIWGRLMVQLEDGRRLELGPGDIATIPARHDAWTIGDEACILYELPIQDEAGA